MFGMLAATLVANFMTPALFVAIEKLVARGRRWVGPRGGPSTEPERVASP